MKAAVVRAFGQSPAFADFADPVAAPGESLVTVTAAALSQLTRARAAGAHYSAGGEVPFIAGVDGVGRREDGARVYFVLPRPPFGAMAERTVAPAGRLIPLPDDLDDVAAAALANPGMSSWAALRERAHLKPGETALINGATGASGQLAVQIARHWGAGRVIVTGRDAAALAALDADAALMLDDDLEANAKAEFARGVDVVLDYLWGASARTLLIAAAKAAPDGKPLRFVQIGAVSGGEIALPGSALRAKAITLMGSGIGSIGLETLVDCIRELLFAAGGAGFKLETRTYPLSEVGERWTEDRPRAVFTV